MEIKGLPVNCAEVAAVKEIGRKLGVEINNCDIDICHKVDTPNSNGKNVIIRLTRRTKRNDILAKARKTRLATEVLGYEGAGRSVFVNEHLTRKNKQLVGAAISKKKTVAWRFVWTSNGKILARRGESTPILRIACMADSGHMTPQSSTGTLSE